MGATFVVAITLGLEVFAATIAVLLLVVGGVAFLTLRPTRPCPQCGATVLAEARRCKTCGYAFAHFRGLNQ